MLALKKITTKQIIIYIVILLVLLFAVVFLFFRDKLSGTSEVLNALTGNNAPAKDSGLKQLNVSVFSNPKFNALVETPIDQTKPQVGKNNPFEAFNEKKSTKK